MVISSGAFELYFTLNGEEPRTRRPLYFHHVPKTAGTSFRTSLRESFERDGGVGSVVVSRIKERSQAVHAWPARLRETFSAARTLGTVNAVMSHYTALLSDLIEEPIVTMIRDPDKHFASSVAFFEAGVRRKLEKTGSVSRTLQQPKINNPQMRSLLGTGIPAFKPDLPEQVKRYVGLVERIANRFVVFRTEDYSALLAFCETEYGVSLEYSEQKVGKAKANVGPLLDRLAERDDHEDPLWLDRILYERVGRVSR